jgi:hypothetical protein
MLVIEARSRCLINIFDVFVAQLLQNVFLGVNSFFYVSTGKNQSSTYKICIVTAVFPETHPLPLCANSTAKALPIPEFPPVITTTKPSNLAEHLHTPPAKYRLEKCSVNMIAKYYWLWELTINCKLLNLQRLYPLRIST